MQWQDSGIILNSRLLNDNKFIVEVFTHKHGRHFGLLRGARKKAMIQKGNHVNVTWQARLSQQLGLFRLEVVDYHSALLMEDFILVLAFYHVAGHLQLLPERVPHSILYECIREIFCQGHAALSLGGLLAHFELLFLQEAGFGLSLKACVLTKTTENLIYVSPKSGCAVSAQAGAPWKEKLLPLPQFLLKKDPLPCSAAELFLSFRLTGYFLQHHVWHDNNAALCQRRGDFLRALKQSLEQNTVKQSLQQNK